MPNEPRLNLRLSEQENQRIKDFCAEKGIKSKSKVGKEALNFALNGKSDIDFGIKSDFTSEPQKALEVSDEGNSKCPHCAGKIRLDPKHYKKFQKEIFIIPSHMPGYQCKADSCKEVHTNPNYLTRPQAICTKCFQLEKDVQPQCATCRQFGTLEPITNSKLSELNIPYPN